MLYITGVTGHSGRWFLKKLAAEGYTGKIRCSLRQREQEAHDNYSLFEGYSLDIEYAFGDLTDEDFLSRSLEGVDTIVHTAGITLSPKIIEASLKNNVKWAILVHTTGRFSKYKSASQEYIQIENGIIDLRNSTQDLAITILRPTMIYGSSLDRNMYRLIDYLGMHKFFPLFGDGSNLMQPVHARDLGYAYYDVLLNPDATKNKEYDLSGKEPLTYFSIIKTICGCLNKKIILIRIPIRLSILAARVYNSLFKNAIITTEQVMRMQEDKAFSHEKAARDFGYAPLSFQEGIKEEVEEYLGSVHTGVKKL